MRKNYINRGNVKIFGLNDFAFIKFVQDSARTSSVNCHLNGAHLQLSYTGYHSPCALKRTFLILIRSHLSQAEKRLICAWTKNVFAKDSNHTPNDLSSSAL